MANVQLAVAGDETTQVILSVPGVQGPAGSNLPPSGATHQLLYKQSSTDYDTGWKLITNDNVDAAAAIAGTKISPNFGSQNAVTTGTNTAASFIPTSSSVPTNGVYLPSANNVAISTNSVGRLFVDSSGNVGIGTGATAPSHSLTVQGGSVTESQLSLTTNAASILVGNIVGGIDFRSNDNNGIFTAAKIQAIADASHNVGAGFVATSLVFSNNAERLRITSTGELKHIGGGTEGDPAVYFAGSAPAKSLYVEATTGHVGLGATSPNSVLDLGNHSQGRALSWHSNATAGNGHIWTQYSSANLCLARAFKGSTSSNSFLSSNSSNTGRSGIEIGNGSLTLYTDAAATIAYGDPYTPSPRFYINSSGNVGVGTTDPQTITHVFGADPILRIQDSSTSISDGFAAIQLAESGTGGSLNNYWQIALEHDIGTGADHLTFKDITSERMRIDSSGRLLVGTTSTSASAFLTIQGNSASSTGGASIYLQRGSANPGGTLGSINFADSNEARGALIYAATDGTWATDDYPSALVFSTTSSGSSSPTPRVQINSTGALQLLAGCPGIDFSAIQTNAAGMTSETLDSYEEGTFTLTIADAASGGNTGTSNTCLYTKVGRVVIVTGSLFSIDTTGLTAGNTVYFQGLPFAPLTHNAVGAITIENITFSGFVTAQCSPSATAFRLAQSSSGSGEAYLNVSALAAGADIVAFQLSYSTAA